MDNKQKIPKKIHYCWFGGNPLPELAKKCIASWRKYCPDYEIIEWNEKNFDINCNDYVKEAYAAKKWAFVSDFARFWVLYKFGGIYFDTDVEIIKPIDCIINAGPFMGCEKNDKLENIPAPGLGLGAVIGMPLYKIIIQEYEKKHFLYRNGTMNKTTVVTYTTEILKKNGWVAHTDIIKICGINIYPSEYFCPINYFTGKMIVTDKTYSIHHYDGSWLSEEERYSFRTQKKLETVFPKKYSGYLAKLWGIIRYRGISAAIQETIGWLKR